MLTALRLQTNRTKAAAIASSSVSAAIGFVAAVPKRLLAVFGPGIVVMVADTDVGSVVTAGQSGVQWGYRLLLLQLVLIPILRGMQYHVLFRSGIETMTSLTVTKRGQVTFRKDVLRHLGIQPGGKIRLDLLPDGRAELRAEQPQSSFRELHGSLRGKGNAKRLSIEEINDAIAASGAAAGMGRE